MPDKIDLSGIVPVGRGKATVSGALGGASNRRLLAAASGAGLKLWSAGSDYHTDDVVIWDDKIWIAKGEAPAGIEPGAAINAYPIALTNRIINATVAANSVAGTTDIEHLISVGVQGTLADGDMFRIDMTGCTLPYPITYNGNTAFTITTNPAFAVVVGNANPRLGVNGFMLINGQQPTGTVNVTFNNITTNPWHDITGGAQLQPGQIELGDLANIDFANHPPANNDALVFDRANDLWVPAPVKARAYVGSSAPANPQSGDLWYDNTKQGVWKVHNGSAWIDFARSQSGTTVPAYAQSHYGDIFTNTSNGQSFISGKETWRRIDAPNRSQTYINPADQTFLDGFSPHANEYITMRGFFTPQSSQKFMLIAYDGALNRWEEWGRPQYQKFAMLNKSSAFGGQGDFNGWSGLGATLGGDATVWKAGVGASFDIRLDNTFVSGYTRVTWDIWGYDANNAVQNSRGMATIATNLSSYTKIGVKVSSGQMLCVVNYEWR